MKSVQDELRSRYFQKSKWTLNRCLANGTECGQKAIHAHTVQNGTALGLLSENGHVIAFGHTVKRSKLVAGFDAIGRNRATAFEGFCAHHDSEIFRPIDIFPLDRTNQEQLFLYAYRSVARELHAAMQSSMKLQAAYQDRIELGVDTGLQPEFAGEEATKEMITAYSLYEYKSVLDDLLSKRRFDELRHETLLLDHVHPKVAVCCTFGIEPYSSVYDGMARISLNLFPISESQSILIFSFFQEDDDCCRGYLNAILSASDDYLKYLISKMILIQSDNFVVSPKNYRTWSESKKETIRSFFLENLSIVADRDNADLFLF